MIALILSTGIKPNVHSNTREMDIPLLFQASTTYLSPSDLSELLDPDLSLDDYHEQLTSADQFEPDMGMAENSTSDQVFEIPQVCLYPQEHSHDSFQQVDSRGPTDEYTGLSCYV